ncbi:hypothetical protein BDZ89DRAFT_1232645 [Hymenopellis radicata]|nr:hypothetical protein BDZ89DRAFT_1232645 [Hymenopellis radicata]
MSVPIPTTLVQSNAVGAIHYSASTTPSRTVLIHVTDSRQTLDALVRHLPQWEDRGWVGVQNRVLVQSTIAVLRKRRALTGFQWVKGHSGNVRNDGADSLAKVATTMTADGPNVICLLPGGLLLPGAKLSCMSLRLLRLAIHERSTTPRTKSCSRILDVVGDEVLNQSGDRPMVDAIWKSVAHRDLSRNVRQWLWHSLHGAYTLGRRWLYIPGCADRAFCEYCGQEDTMAHILFDCDIPGRRTIWELAESVVVAKKIEWHQPSVQCSDQV